MPRDLSIVAVIPLFNGAAFIEEAVRSVFAQTLSPDEIVVVDDGSTDEGPAIVRRLAAENPTLRLLSKPNAGQSSARNHGVAQSASALIAPLDQDDAWYPDHLARLVEPFRAEPGAVPLGWVHSDLDRVEMNGTPIARRLLRHVASRHPKTSADECLAGDMHVLPSASLISRAAFERVGGFDERLAGYEDDDLFLRLLRAGYRNVFVNEALSSWRNNPESASYSPRMARSRAIFIETLMREFPDDPANGRYPVRDLIAPRFAKTLLVRSFFARQAHDLAGAEEADRALGCLLPRLTRGRSILYRALRKAVAMPGLGRLCWRGWLLVRPLLRRRRSR